jgi:hypothetical protein
MKADHSNTYHSNSVEHKRITAGAPSMESTNIGPSIKRSPSYRNQQSIRGILPKLMLELEFQAPES